MRLAEEEEQNRLEKIKQKHEGKYAGMKPAAAMFERALDAKRSVQKSVRGERVITLRKGTISEIRNKIFYNQAPEEPVQKLKQGPKKLIIPDKKDEKTKKEVTPNEVDKPDIKKHEAVVDKRSSDHEMDTTPLKKTKEVKKKESGQMRSEDDKPVDENMQEAKIPKRQSFISDFAALEKTYKILGLSKDPPKSEATAVSVKKRHNSEGKVKNKDKVKAKRKSAILSDVETNDTKEFPVQTEVKIDAMDKGRAIAKRSFFQDMINEKKGIVKKEQELIGPQMRKRGSLINAFEQTPDQDKKRQSITKEEVKVDTHRFNTFLNKFESKDQRADAKAQMIKITKQQKEFERQKKIKEQEKQLYEQQEQERIQREQEEYVIQAAIEKEIYIHKMKEIEEAELRVQQLAEDERKTKENPNIDLKKKVVKKKKKVKKELESSNTEEAPKLALGVVSYSDVKSKFERKEIGDVTEIISPTKPLRINKLMNNPFLENTKSEEKPINREVKVNKLAKNSFMQQLEKRGSVAEDYQQQKVKPVVKKEEPKIKKISSEANIKFESKKEKNTLQDIPNADENKNERRKEVRVSKSIEGQNPNHKRKISKENKSGSTMSLQKIFIDGPKEFFRSSKEKLYKLSKETLCEFNEQFEEPKLAEEKPSRNEMQNYLLSHVLFDGKDVVKKEKTIKKDDNDEIDKYLDKDYKAKIDEYCSLLEDEKPKKKKKTKKKTKEIKIEEKLPSLKMVQIKSIQQQLQQEKPTEKTVVKIDNSIFCKNESNVNKFREMFDTDNNNQNEKKVMERGQNSRTSKRVKSDIFLKIQALENAEKDRLEREKDNEERIKMLLQLEMDRHQNNQGVDIEEKSEDEAEENLKHNILQCLEDEVQNLEQEMLALENEEQLIIEEEAEEIEEAALKKFETNIDDDDTELAEHINQLQEIHVEIEERKKVANKKKKVLERFQHVFDKDESEQKSGIKVGSIHDRLANFLDNKDTKSTKVFEDNVFVGVSDVMSKFKNKLETTADETPTLFSRDEIKRKPNVTALKFEMMNNEEDEDITTPMTPVQKDWSWKKKTAEELQSETGGNEVPSCPPERKKSRNFQDTKFNELLADINAVKQRMNERDAKRQEKENEQKIREMEEAIKEVKEALDSKEGLAFDNFDSDESDIKYIEAKPRAKKVKKNEVKQLRLNKSGDKIGDLKSQLMTIIKDDLQDQSCPKENINISVSKIRQKILKQEELADKEQEKLSTRPNKSSSSAIISKFAEKLVQEEKEEELQLRKAPKLLLKNDVFENEDAPAKTLEELKAENQSQKWAWKEKDMTDLQNYISAYDDIAPNKIMDQQQVLKDLEDEQKVVESLTENMDTAILVQIREEKEREFNKFMDGVKSYLSEDTKTTEEIEFKKGMVSYLALIDDDKNDVKEEKPLTQVKLNTVLKLKRSLFDGNETAAEKKSPKINKLNKDKLELGFRETESAKPIKVDKNVTSEKTLLVKKMFEDKREKSPNKSPLVQREKTEKTSIFERFKRKAIEEKQTKLMHQIKYKQKTISELHAYIEHNEIMTNNMLMSSIRNFKISKEEEKVKNHEGFVDALKQFLTEMCKSEEENIFRGNIQAYLTILENVDSIYNATPKLRKHKGSANQSNMKKAILDKSCERPKLGAVDTPTKNLGTASKDAEKNTSIVSKIISEKSAASSMLMDPKEKKKEILNKYGLKDRTEIVIQAISDDSDDSNDSEDEVDIKKLTDKELSEKYGLPYFEVTEEKDIKRSDSPAGFSNLLSKIRQAQSEKSQSISQTKHKFEQCKTKPVTSGKDASVAKSDSTAQVRNVYESLSPTNSRSSSPFSNYEPGNVVTSRMKKRFEDKTPDRRSFISDGSNSRCNSPLIFTEEIVRSGSTSRMKQMFESDSPSNSRSSSPLLRREPGSIITSKIKRRFEETSEPPRRQSLIPHDAVKTVGSANKIKNIFEFSCGIEQNTPINRGLEKSSTVSNIGSIFQQSGAETNEEKSSNSINSMKSPVLIRHVPLEKCKSLSKIKNAFETGKGLNDEDDVIDKLETRKSIHAELELLRLSGNGENLSNCTPKSQRKVIHGVDTEKASLAASFFTQDKGERSQSFNKHIDGGNTTNNTNIDTHKDIERKKINAEVSELKGLGNIQNTLKPSTAASKGLQKSSTVSDIGSYLKHKFEESPKASPKLIQATQPKKTQSAIYAEKNEEEAPRTPLLGITAGVERSKSFSKFKNAFEDGVGLMNDSEDIDMGKIRVNSELNALKSCSKIQKMFRINKSLSNVSNSPKLEHMDMDDDTMKDVQKTRSAITSMFEAQGPKMTFGGTLKPEKVETLKPKPDAKQNNEENINERKWVFDTIQKYFDVIVEDEKEDEEEDDEEEEADDDNCDDSESDYTSAEDELPEINIPYLTTRKISNTKLPEINQTLPVRQTTASPEIRNKFPKRQTPTINRFSPTLSLPVQRAASLRASTISPLALPRFSTQRKTSVISIESFVDDAAAQFDQLTDGSNLSLNDNCDDEKQTMPVRNISQKQSSSTQSMNKLSKSGSSSKIRGLLNSVVHGSGSNVNLSTFKSNLLAHLKTRGSGNLDPGVCDDSSSEYSEYD